MEIGKEKLFVHDKSISLLCAEIVSLIAPFF